MTRQIAIAQPTLGAEELALVGEVLASGWLTQGPKVAAFEAAFAARHGVPHAVAVNSCTSGLHLALLALGIGPGDEVIVPSFSWVASANVVVHTGATPVLCDVSPATFTLDVADALARVTSRTRAVMAVHLFGRCADLEALRTGLSPDVAIVEDAACAAGAAYQGRPAGSLGEIGVFSFHPRKTITTGEGGMITTGRDDLAERMSSLRNHGATVSEEQRHLGPRPHLLPEFPRVGYNYRMTDLQGAVGLAQLARLDGLIAERAAWAAWYRRELADLDWLHLPDEPPDGRHGWQAFVARIDPTRAPFDAIGLMDALQGEGIATRPGTHAIHTLAWYRDHLGLTPEALPGALTCARHSIALPLHNRMTEESYTRVAQALHTVTGSEAPGPCGVRG